MYNKIKSLSTGFCTNDAIIINSNKLKTLLSIDVHIANVWFKINFYIFNKNYLYETNYLIL